MTVAELVYDKAYMLPNGKKVVFSYREGKRFWFKDISGSFWMTEDQVESLLAEYEEAG